MMIMNSFTITCNECGRESILKQDDKFDDVDNDVHVNVSMSVFGVDRLAFVEVYCDCENSIESGESYF